MVKWNNVARALNPTDCPVSGLFCGIEDYKSQKGSKFKRINIDTADGSIWIPVFKVLGSNIPEADAELHRNSEITVTQQGNGFYLSFTPL